MESGSQDKFHNNAILNIHNKTGLFMTADKAFNERGAYFNDVFDVDEIWIVFDTEKELHPCLNDNWEITKSLRKRCKYADVKLFMTKGCIEYFFLLHYKKARPLIATPQDKMKLLTQLASKEYCSGYKKGDKFTTWKIAENYKTAIENGNWSLKQISNETAGLNSDEVLRKLYFTDSTFTNTHQAVEHLIEIQNNVRSI
ncbi:MAG: RloB family protein [Solobacterium sp.]|nr:RloB family protein [Solobacterium sp.]